jgi:hypothetical protein
MSIGQVAYNKIETFRQELLSHWHLSFERYNYFRDGENSNT